MNKNISVYVLRADIVWYVQVLVIVGGHIAAVYIAHLIALKDFSQASVGINQSDPDARSYDPYTP